MGSGFGIGAGLGAGGGLVRMQRPNGSILYPGGHAAWELMLFSASPFPLRPNIVAYSIPDIIKTPRPSSMNKALVRVCQ